MFGLKYLQIPVLKFKFENRLSLADFAQNCLWIAQ